MELAYVSDGAFISNFCRSRFHDFWGAGLDRLGGGSPNVAT